MNLEQFEQTVIPTLTIPFKITKKGFFRMYKLQSIYKTEFPFNKEFERFFLIEDNMYKLSDSTWNDVNQAFKEERDVNEVLFQHKDKTLVNVPLHKFILVNEAETENLIVVPKDRSSETIIIRKFFEDDKEDSNMEFKWSKVGKGVQEYEQEQMDKWSKIDEEIAKKEMIDNSLETTEDYYKFLQNRADNIVNTIISKDREYTESHWLENFEEACKEEGLEINCENLLKILNGYRLKHKVSINKIHREINKGKIVNQNLIDEKYQDFVNFMIIEQAIITKYNHINKISF